MLQETIKAIKEVRVLIHPEFTDLIQQLKTVQYDKKGNPDKSTYTMDLFDAFMMAVSHVSCGEIYWSDLGNDSDVSRQLISSNAPPGSLKFDSVCEVCGKAVEVRGAEIDWVAPTYCPGHQATRKERGC